MEKMLNRKQIKKNEKKNCFVDFETLFNQPAIGICIASPQGIFLEVNNCFAEMLGYTPSEIIGKNFREFTCHEDLEKDNLLNLEMSEGIRKYFDFEKRYIHKNGEPFWVKIFSNMVSDESGEVLYGIVSIVNIDEQKKNKRELEKINEELMEKNAVLEKEHDIIDIVLKRLEDAERLGNFGTFEYDINKKVGWWSDNQYALHGYEVDDVTPSHEIHTQCVHPDERDLDRANFEAILRGEVTEGRFDYKLIDKQGKRKYIHSEYYIEKDINEQPVRIFGVDQDVTYQHTAQDKIKASEEKFRLLTETSPSIILLHDLKGIITYVNSRGCEFLGYSQNYLTGKSVDFLLPIEQAVKREEIIAEIINKKDFKLQETNIEIFNADNEKKILKLYAKPLLNGEILDGIMVVAYDITGMIEYGKELEKHRDNLEEMVKQRTQQLEEQNKDLESFNKLFVGREFRIKELRDEVKALKKKLAEHNLI